MVIAARRKAGVHPGPPHTAAASRRSLCAAATPSGAFDSAKCLEYARLLALSKGDTPPGDLPRHCRLPGNDQTCREPDQIHDAGPCSTPY